LIRCNKDIVKYSVIPVVFVFFHIDLKIFHSLLDAKFPEVIQLKSCRQSHGEIDLFGTLIFMIIMIY